MDHWMTMVHGWMFVNYDDQGGPSGGRVVESQNHFMGMATHAFLGGKLTLLGTMSLEPATIPSPGSPELFQTGETHNGVLLVDLQHPHDFFAQIAAAWEKAALGLDEPDLLRSGRRRAGARASGVRAPPLRARESRPRRSRTTTRTRPTSPTTC